MSLDKSWSEKAIKVYPPEIYPGFGEAYIQGASTFQYKTLEFLEPLKGNVTVDAMIKVIQDLKI